jgi:hypothetical protein
MASDRIEVRDHQGRQTVRLKFPTAPGGQCLGPDVLADPARLARYLDAWVMAWAPEPAPQTPEDRPAFDPDRVRALMLEDRFLAAEYDRKHGTMPDQELLELLHHTYVAGR